MQERTPEETATEEGMDKKALMEELGKLYQAGVFSQAEFEAQRAEFLEQLRVSRSGQTPMPSNLPPRLPCRQVEPLVAVRPLTPCPSPRDATLRRRGESKHAGASGVSVPSLRSEPSFATAWRGVPQSDG